MRCLVLLVVVLSFPIIGLSATIIVPIDYQTIQQAIDAAQNHDVVLVLPGTYMENIDLKGKIITVKSDQGPDVTVIDGGQAGSVATFVNGEGVNSILEGFTVMNGKTADGGGGVYCNNASPTIAKNIITQNSAYKWGGGICCDVASSPVIEDNVISHNSAIWAGGICCQYNSDPDITNNYISKNSSSGYGGGGIWCYSYASPTIAYNTLSNNSANSFGGGGICCYHNCSPKIRYNIILENRVGKDGGGGGIDCVSDSSPIITNNIISGNWTEGHYGGGGGISCEKNAFPFIANNTVLNNATSQSGGGIYCDSGCGPAVINTILWDNTATTGPEIYGGNPTVTFSNVKGGWPGTGNIDADPLFVDEINGDNHLTYQSPCRDSGDNSAVLDPEDFEGDPRIASGIVDMGADEFYTHIYWTGGATPGGNVEVKITDLPNTAPVVLWAGSGVCDPPMHTTFGDWFLELPIVTTLPLGPIPASGALIHPRYIPRDYPCWEIPIQALVGSRLTNLCVMEVE